MQWFAQAPSNIALIKYMGKRDVESNLPANSSLSYTLNNLQSSVMLEVQAGKKDFWEPLHVPGAEPFSLSPAGRQRFLNHLGLLKAHFHYDGAFLLRSSNNFPQGNGLASSASSFAALTLCAVRALCELKNLPEPSLQEQAALSRLGSGSSCRSFFAPWALWHDDTVEAIDLPQTKLLHQVIIISHAEKHVSSSEAHQRILTSPLYDGRSARAEANLARLIQALRAEDWIASRQICWDEFQDMHQLFATCAQAFTYITAATKAVLNTLQDLWQAEGDGPIVTMDAGPNIHLLYRPDQADMARHFKLDHLLGNYDVL